MRSPRYGEYHIFFTQTCPGDYLEALARADADGAKVVRRVAEFYCTYLPVTPSVFSLDIETVSGMVSALASGRDSQHIHMIGKRLAGLLASLRLDCEIRYDTGSAVAKQVARATAESFFDMYKALSDESGGSTVSGGSSRQSWNPGRDTPPILLVLDRRDDPVTPLLSQWTYLGMLEEVLSLKDGILDLREIEKAHKAVAGGRDAEGAMVEVPPPPRVDPEHRQIVLSCEADDFFVENMWAPYPEVTSNLKALIDEYNLAHSKHQSAASIQEMKDFVAGYRDYSRLRVQSSKHLTAVDQLNYFVEQRHLFRVSQLEQKLACEENLSDAVEHVTALVRDPTVHSAEKLRCVMLFSLRYEERGAQKLSDIVRLMRETGMSSSVVDMLGALQRYGGKSVRSHSELFANQHQSMAKSFASALKSVVSSSESTWLMSHKPLLCDVLSLIGNVDSSSEAKSKYEARFPVWRKPLAPHGHLRTARMRRGSGLQRGSTPRAVQDVIVFYVGGVTFEEGYHVFQVNRDAFDTGKKDAKTGLRILVGGTTVLNSKKFTAEVLLEDRAGRL